MPKKMAPANMNDKNKINDGVIVISPLPADVIIAQSIESLFGSLGFQRHWFIFVRIEKAIT